MKQEKFGNKQLVFKCQQDISQMPDINGGKHCKLCNKSVIDFRNKSYQQFKTLTRGKEHYCGIYYAEQVNEGYAVELNYKKSVFTITALGALFGLTSIPTNAQEVNQPRTEQTPTAPKDSSRSETDTLAALCAKNNCDHSLKKSETLEYIKAHKIIESRKKIIYFSKRFPFIKVRRKRIVLTGF